MSTAQGILFYSSDIYQKLAEVPGAASPVEFLDYKTNFEVKNNDS